MSSAGAAPPTGTTRKKTLHLIRHGQADHNVAGEVDRTAYLSYDFFDASLTAKGWSQVGSLHNFIHSSALLDSVQVVIVSPLTRALQTASGSFGGHEEAEPTAAGKMLLMADGVGNFKHEAIPKARAPPMVALELCREHLGVHPCDRRQTISTYRKQFPGVDFSLCEDEEDGLWVPDIRETGADIAARARKFLQWLLSREETDIAVVSHSEFLYHFLSLVFNDETIPRPANCEMRSVVLDDRKNGKWTAGSPNFPGGLAAVVAS